MSGRLAGLDFNCIADPPCEKAAIALAFLFVVHTLAAHAYLVKRGGFSWHDKPMLPVREFDVRGRWVARSVALSFVPFVAMACGCAITACDLLGPVIGNRRWLAIVVLWLSAMVFAGIELFFVSRSERDGTGRRKWLWPIRGARTLKLLAAGAALVLFATIVLG